MHQQLRDYLRPGLKVVFVGFNPGKRSCLVGHYYAGKGNQFWDLLFESELVQEKLTYEDDHRLPKFGVGLTDVVKRCTSLASDLRADDYRQGVPRLLSRLREKAPRVRAIAFNGIGAYRNFGKLAGERFRSRPIQWGLQPETLTLAGASIFVLPCTSALNARIPRSKKLLHFCELAQWVKRNVR